MGLWGEAGWGGWTSGGSGFLRVYVRVCYVPLMCSFVPSYGLGAGLWGGLGWRGGEGRFEMWSFYVAR